MGLMDDQLVVGDETTYGTVSGALTRAFEFDSESIEEAEGRTEGDPLRVGSSVIRDDRFTPYFDGAAGDIELAVMTKGFGFWLKHMLGAVATTGPTSAKYTHTATEGDLWGKSFTAQINRPFNPAGTNQAFTYRGGKVTGWELTNAVDGNLMAKLSCDFQQVDNSTTLVAAPAYPAGMENFTWAGGVVTIGGSAYDITEFALKWDSGLDVGRKQIRANTDKKEPTATRRGGEFSLKADFESLTQRNRAHATTRAGVLAAIVGTWTGPTAITGAVYPTLTVTIPSARFDKWKGAREGADAINQELSGEVRWNGTNSPVAIAFGTTDTTP